MLTTIAIQPSTQPPTHGIRVPVAVLEEDRVTVRATPRPDRWMRILVPVDFSLASMRTLSHASRLAALLDAHVGVVHVVASSGSRRRAGNRSPAGEGSMSVEAAHARLQAVASRKIRAPFRSVLPVRCGDPAREILEAASEFGADAIVLHTGIRGRIESLLRNRVARGVLQGASCPVLLIPTHVLWPAEAERAFQRPEDWRRVLVPVEMSGLGEQALTEGMRVAGWFNARVTAMNVLRRGRVGSGDRTAGARWDRLVEARETFDAWVRERTGAGTPIRVSLRVGSAATAFLRAARQMQAHLIVMGTQQFSDWRRFRAACAMGWILRETPCPILCIPGSQGGPQGHEAN